MEVWSPNHWTANTFYLNSFSVSFWGFILFLCLGHIILFCVCVCALLFCVRIPEFWEVVLSPSLYKLAS